MSVQSAVLQLEQSYFITASLSSNECIVNHSGLKIYDFIISTNPFLPPSLFLTHSCRLPVFDPDVEI